MMNMHVENRLEAFAHFGDAKHRERDAQGQGWSPGSQPQNLATFKSVCEAQSHFTSTVYTPWSLRD